MSGTKVFPTGFSSLSGSIGLSTVFYLDNGTSNGYATISQVLGTAGVSSDGTYASASSTLSPTDNSQKFATTAWVSNLVSSSETTYSVFHASGTDHSTGLVPDPGATAGTSRFLREDSSWQTITTGGSGATALSGLSDVNVTEGVGIDNHALTWSNSSTKWVATNLNLTLTDGTTTVVEVTTLYISGGTVSSTSAHEGAITFTGGGGGSGFSGGTSNVYLGQFASAPTANSSGGSLATGMLYWNTGSTTMEQYVSGSWVALYDAEETVLFNSYLGSYSSAPSTRSGGGALQKNDIYFNTTSSGTFEVFNGTSFAATNLVVGISGPITDSGGLAVDGNLTVGGVAALKDGASITGGLTVDNVNASTGTLTNETVSDTLTVGESIILQGQALVSYADLSGTVDSQGWPNGTMEYWGSSVTGTGGMVTVSLPGTYSASIDFIDTTFFSTGTGAPGANIAVPSNKTTSTFDVYTYNSQTGSLVGNLNFFWRTRGH